MWRVGIRPGRFDAIQQPIPAADKSFAETREKDPRSFPQIPAKNAPYRIVFPGEPWRDKFPAQLSGDLPRLLDYVRHFRIKENGIALEIFHAGVAHPVAVLDRSQIANVHLHREELRLDLLPRLADIA